MSGRSIQTVQEGLDQTCWRGIRFAHPAEWTPAILSGRNEPGRCILVDRRFQRMQLHWEIVHRPPDLTRMYDELRKEHKQYAASRLSGVPGWSGIVCTEPGRQVVHAGKYFQAAECLVQVILTAPGGRHRQLEGIVLESIRPTGQTDPVLWRALGLTAVAPRAFELISSHNLVGRITWEFRRSGRPPAGLTIERIAMGRYWLKKPLTEWLIEQQPKGFRPGRQGPVDCGGHGGHELATRRWSLLGQVLGRAEHRLERAWRCAADDRIYRLTYQQRWAGEIDWPAGLEVHCCRPVKLIPSVA